MNLKKIIFGIFVFTIAVLSVFTVPTAFAYSFCDTSYVEPEPGFGFQYKVITPTDYTITGGEFSSICVEPDYLWYTIYLDVKEPGSLTVTIPKDEVDLKQFNYESCYPDDLTTADTPDGNASDHGIATVKQISETKDSRVLEFSWSKPISKIKSFGPYAIIDGVDYSEPKSCIGLVESGQLSAEIPVLTLDDLFSNKCSKKVNYNYNLTNGHIKKICYNEGFEVLISLENIIQKETLIIDIPYSDMPLITSENIGGFFLLYNGEEQFPETLKLINQYTTYQTFKIDLIPNTRYVSLIYGWCCLLSSDLKSNGLDHDYNLSKSLLDIKIPCKSDFVSVMKHDYSKSACVTPTTAEKLIKRGWAI